MNYLRIFFMVILLFRIAPSKMMEDIAQKIIPLEYLKPLIGTNLVLLQNLFEQKAISCMIDEDVAKSHAVSAQAYDDRENGHYRYEMKRSFLAAEGLRKVMSLQKARSFFEEYWTALEDRVVISQEFFWSSLCDYGSRDYWKHIKQLKVMCGDVSEPLKATELLYHALDQYNGLEMSIAMRRSCVKNIVCEYMLRQFYNPLAKRKLSYSDPEVTFSDRVMAILVAIDTVQKCLPAEQCSKEHSVVCVSIGSGYLLHDYLMLYTLQAAGYRYFTLNFIDKAYESAAIGRSLRLSLQKEYGEFPSKITVSEFFYPSIETYRISRGFRNEECPLIVMTSMATCDVLTLQDAVYVSFIARSRMRNVEHAFQIHYTSSGAPCCSEMHRPLDPQSPYFVRKNVNIIAALQHSLDKNDRRLVMDYLAKIIERIKAGAPKNGYESVSVESKTNIQVALRDFIQVGNCRVVFFADGVWDLLVDGKRKLF